MRSELNRVLLFNIKQISLHDNQAQQGIGDVHKGLDPIPFD